MTNPIATKLMDMTAQATLLASGADEHGATVDLGPNTAANIRLDIAGHTIAISEYGTAEEDLKTAGGLVRQLSRDTRFYLMGARDSFKPLLGHTYNQGWNSTGLLGSLKVPSSALQLLPLLGSFKGYLATRLTLEVPSKEITVARLQQLYNDLENAIAAENSQEVVVVNKLRARNSQARKLRSRIRGTIAALTQALDPLDARWAAFGLNQPGRKARPEQPGKITVVVAGNAASLKWKRAARAEYYRVWKKVTGLDSEMIPVGSPADLDFTLENLPPNSTIEIAISAVNNGGESSLSERIVVITP